MGKSNIQNWMLYLQQTFCEKLQSLLTKRPSLCYSRKIFGNYWQMSSNEKFAELLHVFGDPNLWSIYGLIYLF